MERLLKASIYMCSRKDLREPIGAAPREQHYAFAALLNYRNKPGHIEAFVRTARDQNNRFAQAIIERLYCRDSRFRCRRVVVVVDFHPVLFTDKLQTALDTLKGLKSLFDLPDIQS